MKIAQITDIHIGPTPELVRGIDVRTNFLQTIELATTYDPDFLVITGDMCFDEPTDSAYQWIANQLEEIQVPVFFISGNHDDTVKVAELMNIPGHSPTEELFFKRMLEGQMVYFLDSSKGCLSSHQKSWLMDQLEIHIEKTAVIFMHHPPLLAGVPHMDNKYALTDREEVMNILKNSKKRVHIFCGHYHVAKSLYHENVRIHITPSTFLQIDARYEEFRVDHTRPGFRLIEWKGDLVSEQVIYV